jgi:hypothetical protein
MIAITKLDDCYSVGDTVTLQRGEYTKDGDWLRGDKILLTKDEIAFRIWAQTQPGTLESCRRRWTNSQQKNRSFSSSQSQ